MRKGIIRGFSIVVIIAAFVTAVVLWQTGKNTAEAPQAQTPPGNTPNAATLQALAVGELAKIVVHAEPRLWPDGSFTDGDGAPVSFKDFTGKITLVNFWATWCAPCVHEMPSLDTLSADLGGADFVVVAISLDRQGRDKAQGFYDAQGIKALPLYLDPTGGFSRSLEVSGLPVTLILDRTGREIARLSGPADWAHDDAKAFIRAAIRGS